MIEQISWQHLLFSLLCLHVVLEHSSKFVLITVKILSVTVLVTMYKFLSSTYLPQYVEEHV